jgi:hypothetical protein
MRRKVFLRNQTSQKRENKTKQKIKIRLYTKLKTVFDMDFSLTNSDSVHAHIYGLLYCLSNN